MSQQLKPCPFCSNAGKVNSHPYSPGLYRAWVECESCAASGPPVSSDKSEDEARILAVNLWNSRIEAPTTYQQKPVEEWVETEEPGIYRTNIIAPDKLGPSVFLTPPLPGERIDPEG